MVRLSNIVDAARPASITNVGLGLIWAEERVVVPARYPDRLEALRDCQRKQVCSGGDGEVLGVAEQQEQQIN